MGTGWRRAFCTTVPRDKHLPNPTTSTSPPPPTTTTTPRTSKKLSFFSSSASTSNPSTPRLRLRSLSSPSLRSRPSSTTSSANLNSDDSATTPTLHCKTTHNTPRATAKSTPATTPKPKLSSNPSSPRSPLKLSLFKNSFKFRSSCGICLNSVKTGQGTAIYTAECSHAFHFPCIADYVRKNGSLVCPVCNAVWKDVPLLAFHKNLHPQNQPDAATAAAVNVKPQIEDKRVVVVDSSPRVVKTVSSKPSSPKSSDFRSYDDDEPLLSPTAGGRFIPIPEAADENVDEEEEEIQVDVEEFQGFFVNPSHSMKSEETPLIGRDARTVQVSLLPDSAVVSVGHGSETYAVALRVKAPPPLQQSVVSNRSNNASATSRAPIDLVAVLDVSGSMTGPKLLMLKRAMRLVISSLGSADRLSIVAFSSVPKRLLPLMRMTAHGQRAARLIVDRLVCGQGSSVGEALRKAAKVLEDRREKNPVATIMLLSDGQDDRVQSNQRYEKSHVSSSSTRFAHIEIPVHAFGFGKSGVYSHEPAEDAFAKCVGGLLSVVVQDLRIQLGFAAGSAPAEICAVYSWNGRPTVLSSGSVRLGDLYAEEERELLVELRVPSSAVGRHHVMSVRCLYKDPGTEEVVYGRDQALLVPRPHAVRSSAPKVERLRCLFITTRAVAEARRLVEHSNNFTSAHHLLASTRALLMQSEYEGAEEYRKVVEVELAELHWRKQQEIEAGAMMMQQQRRRGEREAAVVMTDDNGEPLTPTSAWRAAEKLAKMAMMKKSMNRVSDLHGFENARF
ncbi:E3 ubiquitin-protein ligase WAV3 [Linum grandiflorum]